ncbi:MAG: CBS domain-containing protein [Chitinophagales bacterium]|nr:CBS domain-containing protein [Chitinophagaceae bacterium]MCB9065588.1 CBS domain-containing protein [Chitinophagales bacterium]
MKKRKPVADIMTKHVYTADLEKDDLHSVKDLINTKHLRHVPVIHKGKLAGIISKSDINRLTFSSLFEDQEDADDAVFDMLKIEHVMTGKPKSVSSETTIREVAEILAEEEYHSLPVVDGDELVGIVTTTDVIKYMLEQY